jgi:HK97 family phage portal protein
MFLSNGSLVTKTPLTFTSSSWFPYWAPMSSPTWPSAYAGIYSKQLWVYVVVNKLAKATARLPFPVYRRGEAGRERLDDHPMARLLANPNPGMSAYDLWLWTSSTRDIYGDTFWLKDRDSAKTVRALYPLHPASMTYDAKTNRWRFDNGSLVLESIHPDDLVVFKSFHPDSSHRGLSPLEPLRSTLENEWASRTATSSFWQRGARPGMALSHPGTLSEPAIERLRKQMDDRAAGADKTGVTVVLEEGMKPEVMTLTAEEAQYIETRKLNREEVCAAYDIPPPVVHILDHATFSNITEQMRSMYRDTMGGILPSFEAAIDLHIRQAEFGDEDIYAEFLMDEVLRGDFEARQDALAKAVHMTIAEKRRVENLPFIDGTDRIFLNTATMPLDAIDAQADALVAQTEAGDDTRSAFVIPIDTARALVGRLSWQGSLDEVDPAVLLEGVKAGQLPAVQSALEEETKAGGTVAGLRRRILGMTNATKAKIKSPDKTPHEDRIRAVLRSFFARQAANVMGSGSFDEERWVAELTRDLHAASVSISSSVGRSIMRELRLSPSVYDLPRTSAFLESVSERLAGNINNTTKAQYEAAVEDEDADPRDVFAKAETTRAAGIATGVSTLAVNFAIYEAGRQAGEATGREPVKTWVTGPNPRPAHAAMDGETVPLNEDFSNGLAWPGSFGDVDEVAGCNCDLQIEL